MIVLDFENLLEESCTIPEDENEIIESLYCHSFWGTQIFIVGGSIFSAEYPILCFARELKRVTWELERGKDRTMLFSPDCTCNTLTFSMQENQVSIVSNSREFNELYPERISLLELSSAVCKYFDRVVDSLATFVPALRTNAIVNLWLNDLSKAGDDSNAFRNQL